MLSTPIWKSIAAMCTQQAIARPAVAVRARALTGLTAQWQKLPVGRRTRVFPERQMSAHQKTAHESWHKIAASDKSARPATGTERSNWALSSHLDTAISCSSCTSLEVRLWCFDCTFVCSSFLHSSCVLHVFSQSRCINILVSAYTFLHEALVAE